VEAHQFWYGCSHLDFTVLALFPLSPSPILPRRTACPHPPNLVDGLVFLCAFNFILLFPVTTSFFRFAPIFVPPSWMFSKCCELLLDRSSMVFCRWTMLLSSCSTGSLLILPSFSFYKAVPLRPQIMSAHPRLTTNLPGPLFRIPKAGFSV